MAFFDILGIACLFAAIVAAPFLLVTCIRLARIPSRDRPLPVKSALFFVVPVVIGLLTGGISEYIGQYRLGVFLDSVSPSSSVSVDGKVVQNPREILDVLRRIGPLPAHHSDFGRIFDVTLSDPPRQL